MSPPFFFRMAMRIYNIEYDTHYYNNIRMSRVQWVLCPRLHKPLGYETVDLLLTLS